MLVWGLEPVSRRCRAQSLRRLCSRASRSASASIWAACASPFLASGTTKFPPAIGRSAVDTQREYNQTEETSLNDLMIYWLISVRRREQFSYLTVRRTWWDPARPAPGRRWRRCTWDKDERLGQAHFADQRNDGNWRVVALEVKQSFDMSAKYWERREENKVKDRLQIK